MRCDSDITARMLCSMRRMDTPERLMPSISPTMATISVGLSPAITSSSSSSRGSVASARASSRRLRSGSVSPPAAACILPSSPTRAMTARACSRAAAMAGRRPSAPIFTLSSTDRRGNGRTI